MNILRKIMSRTRKTKSCWVFYGALTRGGYGQVFYKGKNCKPHRVIWELNFGEVPKGLCVCHHCDNPACVRLDHLFLGAPKENSLDRDNKGRTRKGEKHPFAKFTTDEIILIRQMHKSGWTLTKLFRKFGVSPSCMHCILKRKSWKHVLQ